MATSQSAIVTVRVRRPERQSSRTQDLLAGPLGDILREVVKAGSPRVKKPLL